VNQEAFLIAARDETNRAVFLASKLSADHLEYQPTDKSRTTMKLLQYLAVSMAGMAEALITGKTDHFAAIQAKADAVTFDSFADAMNAQQAGLETWVRGVDASEWTDKDVKLPWGPERKLCDAMVEGPLSFIIAYRMQLFLYLKVQDPSYGTWECWGASDNPERVKAEA
jgi:hypothetical protein